jgi:hypothetical protein
MRFDLKPPPYNAFRFPGALQLAFLHSFSPRLWISCQSVSLLVRRPPPTSVVTFTFSGFYRKGQRPGQAVSIPLGAAVSPCLASLRKPIGWLCYSQKASQLPASPALPSYYYSSSSSSADACSGFPVPSVSLVFLPQKPSSALAPPLSGPSNDSSGHRFVHLLFDRHPRRDAVLGISEWLNSAPVVLLLLLLLLAADFSYLFSI